MEWSNELPPRHFLPIDHNLMGAEADKPEVRTVVHLHGGRTPPGSDGHPENWYTPGRSAVHHYPNAQDAALLFYHDHAMGITRLNTYAGLFGLYGVRDAVEDALALSRGEYEIPLVLFDRFVKPDGGLFYPSRNGRRRRGCPNFRELGSGEWEAAAVFGSGAADVPISRAERVECAVLPIIAKERAEFPLDRDGPGFAAAASRDQEAGDCAGRTRGSAGGFQHAEKRAGGARERSI